MTPVLSKPVREIDEFIKQIKESEYIYSYLDKDFEGSCPCFHSKRKIEGEWVYFDAHCWRTTINSIRGGCDCPYSGIHLKSKLPHKDLLRIGRALVKKLNEMEWSSWTLKIDKGL